MAQWPSVADEWFPLPGSSQFLNAAGSTALTLPSIPTGQPAKGAIYVAVLTAQALGQWLRFDGSAVTAAYTGGELLSAGSWMVVYGYEALKAVRVIRSADGGSLAVKYYYFRKTPD
jgi:hypothetical protein